jgi:hypothetical protein
MAGKAITLAFYGCRFPRAEWRYEIDREAIARLCGELAGQYREFGIELDWCWEDETILDVGGYGDLLNIVRLRSPEDGIANLCLGHIIGASANRDLLEDIRRGISRVAFAPEMVEPEGENKRVCHNCGCGC